MSFLLPDQEEREFNAGVNMILAKLCDGARISTFRVAESSPLAAGKASTSAQPYGLIMQLGGKRKTVTNESPFCHASQDDIVAMVTEWVASLRQGERWTTDERYA